LALIAGRSLNNAFAILDEARIQRPINLKCSSPGWETLQNLLSQEISHKSICPKQQISGLIHVQGILRDVPGIDFVYLDQNDIIRHKLV